MEKPSLNITEDQAQAICTEFTDLVEKFLDEKKLGAQYAISAVQCIHYKDSEDPEETKGMTASTFIWEGDNGLKGMVGNQITNGLMQLAEKIITEKSAGNGLDLKEFLKTVLASAVEEALDKRDAKKTAPAAE